MSTRTDPRMTVVQSTPRTLSWSRTGGGTAGTGMAPNTTPFEARIPVGDSGLELGMKTYTAELDRAVLERLRDYAAPFAEDFPRAKPARRAQVSDLYA